jgi:hypothetical protein
MNKFKHLYVIALALAIPALLWSADSKGDRLVLKQSPVKPTVDGKYTDGEYQLVVNGRGGFIALSRNGDSISFCVSFKTKGWVAIGFGSKVMNDSHMIIAFVHNGVPTISEQVGRDHTHSAADKPALVQKAVTETDAGTTLEGEIPLASIESTNAKTLPVIYAYSAADSLFAMHSYSNSIVVALEE